MNKSIAVKTRPADLGVLPDDEHDRELIANVHPLDWINPEPAGRYNLVVIGAGTAGLVTAAGAAGLGAKVALVERHLMGGDCLNVGCVPSKGVIRAGRAAAEARTADRFGIQLPCGVEVDFASAMNRMRQARARISHNDSAQRFKDLGVDVFIGEAGFASTDTVVVDDKVLRFKKAVIATGARAVVPPIPGIEHAEILTNETVFNLTERPDRLLVVGGGPIGVELSQAFARLGSRVTIVERMEHFLQREDPDAAEILARAMERDGVDIRLNTVVKGIETVAAEKVVRLEGKDGAESELRVDRILMGVGRAPNVEGLNLEGVGVEYDLRAGVKVDDRLRTTHKRIFAAGDVAIPYRFTHTADFAARIVIQNALFMGRKKLSALTVPWCTYTDAGDRPRRPVPRARPRSSGHGRSTPTSSNSIAMSTVPITRRRGPKGSSRSTSRKGSDTILGARPSWPGNAGDLISEISVAIVRAGLGLGSSWPV